MTRKLSPSARIYRALIRLYPSDFRWHHETEVQRFFQEAEVEERQHRWGLFRLWSAMLSDLVTTLPREHWAMLSQDIRYSLRSMYRNPGFSGTAILTLAVVIAANSAIFSVVHAVLILPIPYPDPEQITLLRTDLPLIGLSDNWLSEPEVLDLRARARLFSQFALLVSNRVTLATEQSAVPLTAGLVSANFLDFLGGVPAQGRLFKPEEELPNGPAVALISHQLWMRRFGGDTNILGRVLRLDGRSVTIVGVTPDRFQPEFPVRTRLPSRFDLWLPYQVNYQEQDRHSHFITVLGRLQPGVSLAEAQSELDAIAAQLSDVWYAKTGFGLRAIPLHDDLTAEARPALLLLMAAVLLVLLITCSNVANLLLARNSVRSREIAIRAALGARTTRLARQIFTESLILTSLGGAFGLGLTFLALPMLLSLSPQDLPGIDSVTLNNTVLGFTLGCCGLAALLFSMAPLLQTSRQNRVLSRHLGSRDGSSDRGQGLRRMLIVSEVALAFVLLVAGGLMFQTLRALDQEELGYQPEGVFSFQVSLPSSKYSRDESAPFFEELERRIGSIPSVLAVGANMQLPLSGSSWSGTDTFYETTNGLSDQRKEHFEVDQRVVTPGYFRAMGTALKGGRFFSLQDNRASLPVVLIDETLAERVWPGADPVGKRMSRGADPEQPFFFEVAGVVEHQRYHDLGSDGRPQVYFAQNQLRFDSLTLVVKSVEDPSKLLEPIRSLVREMDPDLPIEAVSSLTETTDRALAPTRFTLTLLSLFAAIGLFLAAIGLFGVINYTVRQRTREIAIRIAMGARSGSVVAEAVRSAVRLAGLGTLLGCVASLGVTRFLESLLFGVSSRDSLTFLVVASICIGLAILASVFPAFRAARIDPVVALRNE